MKKPYFLLLSVLIAGHSYSQLTIRNNSSDTAFIAIAYSTDVIFFNSITNQNERSWNTKGWYKIAKGESKNVIDKINNQNYYISIMYRNAFYEAKDIPNEGELNYSVKTVCNIDQFRTLVEANNPTKYILLNEFCMPGFRLIHLENNYVSSHTFIIK